MKKTGMKKFCALILGLAVILCLGSAAAEGAPVEVPHFSSVLQVREIGSADEALAYAKEFWQMDYMGVDVSAIPAEAWSVTDNESYWSVIADLPEGSLDLYIEFDGSISYAANWAGEWFNAGESDYTCEPIDEPEEKEEADVRLRQDVDALCEFPFLAAVNPPACKAYVADHTDQDGLTHYMGTFHGEKGDYNLDYSEFYDNKTYSIRFVVQVAPTIRILYFDPYCTSEEGGNG